MHKFASAFADRLFGVWLKVHPQPLHFVRTFLTVIRTLFDMVAHGGGPDEYRALADHGLALWRELLLTEHMRVYEHILLHDVHTILTLHPLGIVAFANKSQ